MPRIEAPTVAEHRARQHAALLDVAERLLRDGGWNALTFAALGSGAGLARSSVYEYFETRGDAAVAVCERAFARWQERIETAMAEAATPAEQVAAYVRAQLALVVAGEHRIGAQIARAPLDPAARARIGAWHGRWRGLLHAPLGALGVAEPELAAGHVQGVVEAATRQLEAAPADAERIVRAALAFVAAATAAARAAR